MPLYKLSDFDSDYVNSAFEGKDIKGIDVYAGSTDDKVGSVHDVLVDQTGHMRYLVVDTGFWIFGKKVLVPLGRCRFSQQMDRVLAIGLTSKEQVENMPAYDDDMTVDYDHEEQVRGVYRSSRSTMQQGEPSAYGVGYAGADSAPKTANTSPTLDLDVGYAGYDRDTYTYDREPYLYALNEQDHPSLKLSEERLVAGKTRRKG